jgi:SAM-dependent methyltransferase
VIDGIPRTVVGAREALSAAVISGFDREWASFSEVDTPEQSAIFDMYFDLVPASDLEARTVLDAGCGAGRWAVQVAKRGGRVVALDAGRSVEVASRNGRPWGIAGVQGDVTRLPFRPGTFDLVYSLGVLHHVPDTEAAARELVRVLRPGGTCLLYLYYALDGRGLPFRAIFLTVDALRRVMSRAPRRVLVPLTDLIAALIYLPLARLGLLLRRLGLRRIASALPLSAYADRSFRVMRNDSLDRFGTRLEKRFTKTQVIDLMRRAGLENVRVSGSAPYWHAVGRRAKT